MKTYRITGGLGLCLFALSLPVWGQQYPEDARLVAAVVAAQQQYTAAFVGPPQLYNGPEYVDYAKRYHAQIGHQFFSSPRQMDFFTGDQAGRYLVVLQGLAANGQAGSTSFTFEVKPAL